MSTVFIALPRECRYKFPECTRRHLDLPKKLHAYFIG
jgi:phage terminase Nu1 subunit (DNA packaging protein)